MNSPVGEKIREFRKMRGLTQKQLGEKTGIAEPTIRRYELGKLNPKYETLQKIAMALHVAVYDLYPDEQKPDIIKRALIERLRSNKAPFQELSSETKIIQGQIDFRFQDNKSRALFYFNRLNAHGKEVAVQAAFDTLEEMCNYDFNAVLSILLEDSNERAHEDIADKIQEIANHDQFTIKLDAPGGVDDKEPAKK